MFFPSFTVGSHCRQEEKEKKVPFFSPSFFTSAVLQWKTFFFLPCFLLCFHPNHAILSLLLPREPTVAPLRPRNWNGSIIPPFTTKKSQLRTRFGIEKIRRKRNFSLLFQRKKIDWIRIFQKVCWQKGDLFSTKFHPYDYWIDIEQSWKRIFSLFFRFLNENRFIHPHHHSSIIVSLPKREKEKRSQKVLSPRGYGLTTHSTYSIISQ